MTPAEEREIASKYIGGFAWPTVLLFIFNCAVYTGTILLCVNGSLPMPAGFVINSIITYFFYTIHHEANHGNISAQNKSLRWVDKLMGSVASLPLQLNFQAYAPSHLLHHAHTNIPGRHPTGNTGRARVSATQSITTSRGFMNSCTQMALPMMRKKWKPFGV